MKNKVLKSAIIILLIIVITMADFMLVGKNLVTYALKNMENSTNHDNVEFAAYFKTEEETSHINYEMNNDEMKLYMKVAVENEGYFDGVITLEDSNFKLKQEKLSDYINKIEENKITLNRIRAGKTVEIEIGIEPIIEESYNEDMLSKDTILKLTGDYIDNEEESTAINSEKSVALSLTVPSNIETTLDGKVITNRIYKVGDTNKRIVQVELNSGVVENIYPIKASTFEVSLPDGVEDVEVISKGTYATNGEAEKKLDKNFYEYDIENKTLKITFENKIKDGKISWKKDSTDTIIVTLILSEDVALGTEEYNIKSKVKFEGKELEKEVKYSLVEDADGIIRASIENKEEIYKGKIYSKEDREYKTTTNIEINYANLIEQNIIEEKTVYRTETEEKTTNIEYKTTTIKKSEIEKILGQEGILTIQNGSNQEQITVNSEADENGNIVITYEAGVKNLHITLTKAIETGIIRLNHTKVIKAEEYSKEEIDAIKKLVEVIDVKYNTAEYTFERGIQLKDVTSEVGLTVIPQTISAEENKEMQIVLTLKTDNEKYELFKNPTFTLVMPDGVTVNSVSNETISAAGEGFTISKLEPINGKEIRVEIVGEQQKYVTSDINVQINFNANVSIKKLMPNKIDTIKMQYTNQGKTHEIQSEPINIIASNAKIVTHLKLENYNGLGLALEQYSDGITEIKGELPIENDEILEVPVKYTIINNYDSAIALTPTIVANKTDKEGNKQELMNYVSKEIIIEAGTMQAVEQVLQVPAGLYFSEMVTIEALVEYTYSGTEYSVPNIIELATEEKEGIRDISLIENKIQLETFMQLGDKTGIKESDEIYNEQVVKYIIEVTNISNEAISNLIITNSQENGNIYDLKEIQVTNIAVQEEPMIEHRYGELDTNTKTFEIDTLNPGESRELVCKVVVKKSDESDITSANISILADGIEQRNIKKISNTVKDSTLKVITERALNEEVQIYADSSYMILTTIKNLTDTEIKDTSVRIHLSEGLIYNESSQIKAIDGNEQDLDIIKDIQYNQEQNYIDINITRLEPGQEIMLTSMVYIEKMTLEETSKEVTVYLNVNDIISNDVITGIEQMETKVTVVQKVNITEGQKIKDDDKVIITGEITNVGNIDSTVTIEDKVVNGLEINKVTIIKNGERLDKTEVVADNAILTNIDIGKGETIIVEIEATVNTSKIVTDIIENTIFVKPFVSDEVVSNTITLAVESNVDTDTGDIPNYDKPEEPVLPEEPNPEDPIPENPDSEEPNPEDPTLENPNPENPNPEETKYSISGNVWVDKNKNNVKDDNEMLKDVIVKIVDLNNQNTFLKDENGNEIEVKTNENGEYRITDIAKGKYNVIFKYNTGLYELNENSIIRDYIIDSTKEKVAITNNINLEADKIVDLQLIELTEFNFKIDKYISKVIVQTQRETKTIEYTKQQLVREEISSKYISGATVLVEYTMEVSNVGELAGYVTEIVDYLPTDMKYHSELNTQWYEGEDGNLYNASLATTIINPGETKTVKLVLLKTMTRDNAGTTANTAEISETLNIKEYVDIDLNDNQSKAEIIISTATGSVITYLIVVINSILIVAVGTYLIKKKVIK